MNDKTLKLLKDCWMCMSFNPFIERGEDGAFLTTFKELEKTIKENDKDFGVLK